MAKLKTYRDLIAWKKAMDLAKRAYLLARNFPKDELYGLSSQLRRAAVSVPANIAEGYARNHRKEYLHFLGIARGSLAEVQTLVILAVELELVDREHARVTYKISEELYKILLGLRNSLDP